MEIKLNPITVKELVEDYVDNGEEGVFGYAGKLNIRPPYQREFVYQGKDEYKKYAVIDTLLKGFPLNVMYWAVGEDGNYEIIDGQQRTISVAQYVKRKFSFNGDYFNPARDEHKHILDYPLMVYFCSGTDKDKLDWFETINIAGSELTKQELRNAVYTGPWLMDAKRRFSKTTCVAWKKGRDYLNGSPIRQDYLETVIKWIIESKDDTKIREYMSLNQNEDNADELWIYFESLIDWIEKIFPNKRMKLMKGLDWGVLYNKYKDVPLDPDDLEQKIQTLIADEDVTSHKGIYPYLLTGEQKYLNLRSFSDAIKRRVYEKQGGKCKISGKKLKIGEMEADHITPWSKGGRTIEENCQMISKALNRSKGAN